MSDLQLSLLVIGALVVLGVYLFNWWQELQFRRRAEQAFAHKHDDVLLRAATETASDNPLDRIEPHISPAQMITEDIAPAADGNPAAEQMQPVQRADNGEAVIDYAAEVESDSLFSAAQLAEALRALPQFNKPVSCSALDEATGGWVDPAGREAASFRKLRLALQLANRAGPATLAQLREFADAVQRLALALGARAHCPDTEPALERAVALDKFCMNADIAVGINIISRDTKPFAGTKIRALAEAAGLKLEDDLQFHYRNEQKQTVFVLDNQESTRFHPEELKNITTHGITLIFEVPRVADGLPAFDRMVEIGKGFAASLGGALVDDNRVPLTDAALDKIRAQLQGIYSSMEAHSVAAGSARAQRLFS
jgi:FtsZ-interacting cell division protein ZipA